MDEPNYNLTNPDGELVGQIGVNNDGNPVVSKPGGGEVVVTDDGVEVPGSVKADELRGVADYIVSTTAEFNDAITNLSNGETILISGTIKSNKLNNLDDVHNVTIAGFSKENSVIKTQDGVEAGLFRLGQNSTVSNITFQNLTLDGNADNIPDGAVYQGHGIYAADCNGLTLDTVEIRDTPKNASNSDVANSAGVVHSGSDLRVHDCHLDNTGYRGIEIAVDGAHITDLSTINIKERSISLDANRVGHGWSQHVHIDGCQFEVGNGEIPGSFISAFGADYDGSGAAPEYTGVSDPLIDITVANISTSGEKRSIVAFRHFASGSGPFRLHNISGDASDGENIGIGPHQQTANPDEVRDCTVEVSDCTVKNAGQTGLKAENVSDLKISDLTVRDSGNHALLIENCPDFKVVDSTFINPNVRGCQAFESPRGEFSNVTIEESNYNGFNVSNSDEVDVIDCTVRNPNQEDAQNDGVRVDSSELVRVEGLRIMSSDGLIRHGINVVSSTTGIVKENVFGPNVSSTVNTAGGATIQTSGNIQFNSPP